jgi:hypothetical protein
MLKLEGASIIDGSRCCNIPPSLIDERVRKGLFREIVVLSERFGEKFVSVHDLLLDRYYNATRVELRFEHRRFVFDIRRHTDGKIFFLPVTTAA